MLETFVVATGSDPGWCAFFLLPDQGVIACVRGSTDSTAASGAIGRLCGEAAGYVRLALGADLDRTPGLAQYVAQGAAANARERVVAGLRLAGERLRAAEATLLRDVALTAVVLVADAATMHLMAVGPNPLCWRVRGAELSGLLPGSRNLDQLSVGLGQGGEVEPLERAFDVSPGDLFGIGMLDAEQARALREDGAQRLDRALARCASSPILRQFPLVMARCGFVDPRPGS